MMVLRSTLFYLVLFIITPPYALLSFLLFPLNPFTRYRIITSWCHIVMFALRKISGLHYRIKGAENIPSHPCVILSNHQSAWETIAFLTLFPPLCYVLKKELHWVPFFGWGLAQLSMISIDRSAGDSALVQVLEQGLTRLKQGFWVAIFPEGTRVAPGEKRRYKIGGAALAVHTKTPVLPVAHNAGYFWPRNTFLKRPGIITVSIGALIWPADKNPEQLNKEVEEWIESEIKKISVID